MDFWAWSLVGVGWAMPCRRALERPNSGLAHNDVKRSNRKSGNFMPAHDVKSEVLLSCSALLSWWRQVSGFSGSHIGCAIGLSIRVVLICRLTSGSHTPRLRRPTVFSFSFADEGKKHVLPRLRSRR